MDCNYGHGINDFILPKDEDLFDICSPENWSRWEISEPSVREAELNYIDECFIEKIDLEPSQHDSSSVCGQQPFQQAAFSCDKPNYELWDLSSFEQIDDIFEYKLFLLHSKFRQIYLYDGSQCGVTQSYLWFPELYKHEPVMAWGSLLEGLPSVENSQKSFFLCSENHCSNIPDLLQKDFAASKLVPCDSESEDWLNVEEPTPEELDSFEWCSRDETMDEQFSLEESILQNLETVIAQFNDKTRICFRDALNRLAQNTRQQDAGENWDQDLYMPQAVHGFIERSEEKQPMESETNIVDRAVANLMFNKMELNLQDVPLLQARSNWK
ncbi:hypothetical protein PIB30_053369 [Stylosanthes scabra]|uniref:Protein LNK3 n=1 Tax=Stylosanthes scabra TaxID=79078 RepID=A0ABU6QI42_9FABA|nr:hypothetical protein [Stylosanthes scabra]